MTWSTPVGLCTGLAALVLLSGPGQAAPQLRVEGTEFVLEQDNGRVLRGEALAGAVLVLPQGRIRIASVAREKPPYGGEIFLYRFLVENSAGSSQELCEPDPNGQRLGFPLQVPGEPAGLTCTGGAVGKCVRFGYQPWHTTKEGPSLQALHQACVNLVTASYGGDRGTTRNGTPIDIYDRFGIQQPAYAPGMAFEAAWSPRGAVCVARPRIEQNISLDEIRQKYSHLQGFVGEDACLEEKMRSRPDALLFNHSYPGYR
jgi:hypothetical protein